MNIAKTAVCNVLVNRFKCQRVIDLIAKNCLYFIIARVMQDDRITSEGTHRPVAEISHSAVQVGSVAD